MGTARTEIVRWAGAVDGEIVLWCRGRLDFNRLQRRYAQRRHARERACPPGRLRRARPYVSGARVWLKYKSRQTTDAVIGGATGSLHRPAALLLGRYVSDTGRLHYAGRTTHLTDAQAAAVAPLLVAAIGGHPWPAQLTVNWRSKPTGYHQVAPLVVVEIRSDIATDQGRRWRHAVRLLRVRDIAPNEVPFDLDLETRERS
ncbi:hypothetical protein [Actinopolymorpha pittospori]|uniref:ATP-dependent DNA ligase n=1 Tax=Actinopolymorpha pittospori TaxID=648752 RepID=A0A927RNA2_9ACTN|nr:hypothetical protein [Actinopolymorpha pittospori]MBE1609843.1 ATP-dependent DNA ligase [Actinopolymorpha pittospori]